MPHTSPRLHAPDTPDIYAVQQAIARWHLTEDGAPFCTHSSVLQAVRHRGKPAMVKVALCAEESRGVAALYWWAGEGAVRVLAHHADTVLLERACGVRSLADMARTGQDSAASRIICAVAARLHAPRPRPLPELVPLSCRFASLFAASATQGALFRDAGALARELLATPQDCVVLHGDLHHANILDAGERGWLAIDPKGLLGERGFDFANVLCNPEYAIATKAGRLEQQVHTIAEAAGLERKRLLAWVAVWAALSALWHREDGGAPDCALAVAERALYALRA